MTGEGGCGKSFLLQHLRTILAAESTYFVASTGIAALPLCGTTLHAWAGITPHKVTVETQVRNIRNNSVTYSRWLDTKVLVIDEISMISCELFEFLEEVAREVRGNSRMFGGIQLICSGDFLQLPPVETRKGEKAKFVFESHLWESCFPRQILLKEAFRQTNSDTLRILGKIRKGIVDEDVLALIKPCMDRKMKCDGIIPTVLFPTRCEVSQKNEEKLAELKADEHVFKADDWERNKRAGETLAKSCIAPALLTLKIGAQVMMLKNNSVQNLVNGSRGVVVAFDNTGDEEQPVVKWKNGSRTTIGRERWELKDGNRTLANRLQFPLILAWALTVHKSQGMTLDSAEMDISRCFEEGQVYVALSRVRGLEYLCLRNCVLKRCVKANARALAYYEKLSAIESQSTAASTSSPAESASQM